LLILLVLIRAAVNIVKIGIIEQLIDLGVYLADVPCQEVVLVDLSVSVSISFINHFLQLFISHCLT
jgi:hypothetical protein